MYADLFCPQGTDFNKYIKLTNSDGSAVNTSGCLFYGAIRKNYYSKLYSAWLNVVTTDAANGNVWISLSASLSANIEYGRFLYSINMVDSDNNTSRIREGFFHITPSVIMSQPLKNIIIVDGGDFRTTTYAHLLNGGDFTTNLTSLFAQTEPNPCEPCNTFNEETLDIYYIFNGGTF